MLSWWDIVAPGCGSITVKAEYRAQAIMEAEARLGCSEEQISRCIRLEPVHERDRPGRDLDGRMRPSGRTDK